MPRVLRVSVVPEPPKMPSGGLLMPSSGQRVTAPDGDDEDNARGLRVGHELLQRADLGGGGDAPAVELSVKKHTFTLSFDNEQERDALKRELEKLGLASFSYPILYSIGSMVLFSKPT